MTAGMDTGNRHENDESRELSQSMKDIQEYQQRNDVTPRMYVERGINRHTGSNARNDRNRRDLRQERLAAENASVNPLAEYREARLRDEAAAHAEPSDDLPSEDNRPTDTAKEAAPAPSSGRFHLRARPARQWAEDEQPPLLDTVVRAVERKANTRREFHARYAGSSAGASTIRRESDQGGAVVREVEYFVPKITGDNADSINYGGKKPHARPSKNRRPMRSWQKASITTVSLLLVFFLLLGVAASALLNRMNFVSNAQKNALAVRNMAADQAAADAAKGVDDSAIKLPDAVMFDSDIENILLIGSDRRTMDEEGRSDAMMMFTIDRKHKKIKMTSFLRDLYIKIPGKYGTRLNSAYAVGGEQLLRDTIEGNLGVRVDKYIIIDFNAFKTVVNKIGKINGKGGIKITVTAAEADYMCHHEKYGNFPRFEKGAGTYYMNGAEALNYARIRKIDSDFGRTKRQRKVLTEIISELKGLGYMDLINIGYACLEYVTTDFSKGELVGLAAEAPNIMNYGNCQISIPVKGSYTTQHMSNGNEVLAANLEVNADILVKFIYDDDMTYEGNNKEVKGIFLPDLKGIANTNVTTMHHDEDETAATSAAEGGTSETTSATSATSSTAKGQTTASTAKGQTTATTAKGQTTASTTAAAAAKGTVEVNVFYLNVRSKPDASSAKVGGVNKGQRLAYTELKDGWYHVILTDGKTNGWVKKNYVKEVADTDTASTTAGAAKTTATTAAKTTSATTAAKTTSATTAAKTTTTTAKAVG